jgi:hypothetical protein
MCGLIQDTCDWDFNCKRCKIPLEARDLEAYYEKQGIMILDYEIEDMVGYDVITCPHCGEENDNVRPYEDHDCSHCGQSFRVNIKLELVDEEWNVLPAVAFDDNVEKEDDEWEDESGDLDDEDDPQS